jgi:hypothetical protein
VAAGLLFALAWLGAPRHGLIARRIARHIDVTPTEDRRRYQPGDHG